MSVTVFIFDCIEFYNMLANEISWQKRKWMQTTFNMAQDNNTNKMNIITALLFFALLISISTGQVINRAPHFLPVTGDMSQFSLPENTIVGTPVYQLKGLFFVENSLINKSKVFRSNLLYFRNRSWEWKIALFNIWTVF